MAIAAESFDAALAGERVVETNRNIPPEKGELALYPAENLTVKVQFIGTEESRVCVFIPARRVEDRHPGRRSPRFEAIEGSPWCQELQSNPNFALLRPRPSDGKVRAEIDRYAAGNRHQIIVVDLDQLQRLKRPAYEKN